MAPLFSKVDSNKLWIDVQNEEAVIRAKFGTDLFNICKVMGRKTKWPRFFGLPCTSAAFVQQISGLGNRRANVLLADSQQQANKENSASIVVL